MHDSHTREHSTQCNGQLMRQATRSTLQRFTRMPTCVGVRQWLSGVTEAGNVHLSDLLATNTNHSR